MDAFDFHCRLLTDFEYAWIGKDSGGIQVSRFNVTGMAWELVNILYILQRDT